MSYKEKLSYEYVAERLSYDPETGIFRWLKNPARNFRIIGKEAGCTKAIRITKTGNPASYRYIRIGRDIPAAQLAWLLYYREWPKHKVLFIDKDPLNLQISNLELSDGIETKYDHSDREQRKAYLKEHRATHIGAWKERYLQRSFGISLEDYQRMHDQQNGKCAICKQPEKQRVWGKIKLLSVDHCHLTGKIRGLLCVACNQTIGQAGEDVERLKAMIRYLNTHKANQGQFDFV